MFHIFIIHVKTKVINFSETNMIMKKMVKLHYSSKKDQGNHIYSFIAKKRFIKNIGTRYRTPPQTYSINLIKVL